MYKDKSIAVVIPCYNEEKQIGRVIETMPEFVDRIVVVNDDSNDDTAGVIQGYLKSQHNNSNIKIGTILNNVEKNFYNHAEYVVQENNKKAIKYFADSKIYNQDPDNDRIILINLTENSGVGAAIARGYKWSKDHGIDCTAVMAGDGQMDPSELESICKPVIEDKVDYVKGNRLIHRSSLFVIPKIRYFGNSILSILTKIASGYWHVSDTQTGYTAISKSALNSIRLYKIYDRYGMPNDMLVKLNIAFCSLKEVEIKPVYDIGEKSKMKVWKVVPKISWLLFRSFFKRIWKKYLFRDFHPLFLLYHASFLLLIFSIPYVIKILRLAIKGISVNPLTTLAFVFLFISGFQSLLFAMWMDIQDNERLYK